MSRFVVFSLWTSLLCPLPTLAASAENLAIEAAASSYLHTALASYGEQASFKLGRLDPRLQLAPCQRVEISPGGGRLLGNVLLRARCAQGGVWMVQVPASISINADYWVASRALNAGDVLTEADLSSRRGELATLPSAIAVDSQRLLGRQLTQPLNLGQPLRYDMVKPASVVQSQQRVKVLAKGAGFEVASEGVALGSAAEGQAVSVRMEAGNIVQGIARSGGLVEVQY